MNVTDNKKLYTPILLLVAVLLCALLLCACGETVDQTSPGQKTPASEPTSAVDPSAGTTVTPTVTDTSAAQTATEGATTPSGTPVTPTETPVTSFASVTPSLHVHAFGEWKILSEPTCTLSGQRVRACACGEEEYETLPAAGHTPEGIPGVAPTCTEAGKSEGSICAVCGEILTAQVELPAAGHTPEVIPGVAPTCTEAGKSEGSICAVCGEILTAQVELPAAGHTPEVLPAVAPTCTEKGLSEGSICAVCGEILTAQVELSENGHTIEFLPAVAPTCTETGLGEGCVCAVCGEVFIVQSEIPATGHTPEVIPGVAPTCTEAGKSEGSICAVCGEILDAPSELPPLGHDETPGSALLPTSAKAGHTAGSYCARCGAVLTEQQALPAKGCDWMLEDGAFKLLLIGNSFSQDASNFRFEGETNQLLNDLRALLGEDVEILIGVCQSGSKTMAWHASQAASGRNAYSFHVISSSDPVWRVTKGSDASSAYALSYTNWDIVTLQPYKEADSGMYPGDSYVNEIEERFYPLSSSLSYMLDHVQTYAPQADVYCYMQWATSNESLLNVSLAKYNRIRDYFPTVLTFSGQSGKVFEDIIPVGLAIQNARSTYFSLFNYHTGDTSQTQVFSYDAQYGLLRDGLHLTYNVGRYIASLTFALTLVPEDLRVENVTLPAIRKSEGIGKLPDEYTVVAQEAVFAALSSWRKGSLEVTQLGYTENPSARAAGDLAKDPLIVPITDSEEELIAALTKAAQSKMPQDCTVVLVKLPGGFPSEGAKSFAADVTVRSGYDETTVRVQAWMS